MSRRAENGDYNMHRFFFILIFIIEIVGCQGIPSTYDMPHHWDKLSPTEKQAWLEGYYWGSRNYSMGWGIFPLSSSTYPHPGGAWEPSYSGYHLLEEHRTEPQKNEPSAPSAQPEPPPHTLSSQSTHCSAENPCKQFRPR